MDNLQVIENKELSRLEQLEDDIILIQTIMSKIMIEKEHYGTIPGTDKPTLYKAGAEKLCTAFRLAPSYQVARHNIEGDHREYEIIVTMTHITTGNVVGQGVGLCSTMEGKYRYRTKWINNEKHKIENENLWDQMNTVLKMAKKRALVDAVLTCTAASDIFTQDLEDFSSDKVATSKPKTNGNGSDPNAVWVDIKKAYPPDCTPKEEKELRLAIVEIAKSSKKSVPDLVKQVTIPVLIDTAMAYIDEQKAVSDDNNK